MSELLLISDDTDAETLQIKKQRLELKNITKILKQFENFYNLHQADFARVFHSWKLYVSDVNSPNRQILQTGDGN